MPSPLARHAIFLHNWAPTTTEALAGTPPMSSLSATGAGVWSAFPDDGAIVYSGALGIWPQFRQYSHVGRYNITPGTFVFAVRAYITAMPSPDDIQFRLRDTTNAATILTIGATLSSPPVSNWPFHWGIIGTLDDIPSGDAVLEPQYTLVSPATATYGGAMVGLSYGL